MEDSAQPDIRAVLDPLSVHPNIKAMAWDHYYGATDESDFKARFDVLPLPRSTKAALWDLRFGSTVASGPQNQVQRLEPAEDTGLYPPLALETRSVGAPPVFKPEPLQPTGIPGQAPPSTIPPIVAPAQTGYMGIPFTSARPSVQAPSAQPPVSTMGSMQGPELPPGFIPERELEQRPGGVAYDLPALQRRASVSLASIEKKKQALGGIAADLQSTRELLGPAGMFDNMVGGSPFTAEWKQYNEKVAAYTEAQKQLQADIDTHNQELVKPLEQAIGISRRVGTSFKDMREAVDTYQRLWAEPYRISQQAEGKAPVPGLEKLGGVRPGAPTSALPTTAPILASPAMTLLGVKPYLGQEELGRPNDLLIGGGGEIKEQGTLFRPLFSTFNITKEDEAVSVPLVTPWGDTVPVRADLWKQTANTLIGMVQPESLAMVLLGGVGGAAVAAVANSPVVRAAVANLPNVARAFDIVVGAEKARKAGRAVEAALPRISQAIDAAANAAVPAGFGALGAVRTGESIGAAIQATTPEERQRQAISAITNALFMAGAMLGAKTAIGEAGGRAVPSVAPKVAAAAERAGGTATPGVRVRGVRQPEVSQTEARATADALDKGGFGLAADRWRDLVDTGRTKINVAGEAGQPLYVSGPVMVGKNPAWQVTDEAGENVFSGTVAQVNDWIAKRQPELLPPVIAPGAMGPIAIHRGAVQARPISLPRPIEVEMSPGKSYTLPAGKVTIVQAEGGMVRYTFAPATGEPATQDTISAPDFEAIVQQYAAQPEEATGIPSVPGDLKDKAARIFSTLDEGERAATTPEVVENWLKEGAPGVENGPTSIQRIVNEPALPAPAPVPRIPTGPGAAQPAPPPALSYQPQAPLQEAPGAPVAAPPVPAPPEGAGVPVRLVRVDRKEFDFSEERPHGTYYTIGERSPHVDVGDTRFEGVATGARTLEAKPGDVKHARFGRGRSGSPSAGVAALRQLSTPDEFNRLLQMPKSELVKELNREYPGPDYSKYYDSYELLEAYGAQKSRQAGYDSITLYDEASPEFSEYVALKPEAANIERTVPVAPEAGVAPVEPPAPSRKEVVPVPRPQAEGAGRAPWELTREEFAASQNKPPNNVYVQQQRDAIVKQAVQQGKPVPPEVLADYPDLKPAAAPPAEAQAPAVQEPAVQAEGKGEKEELFPGAGVYAGQQILTEDGLLTVKPAWTKWADGRPNEIDFALPNGKKVSYDPETIRRMLRDEAFWKKQEAESPQAPPSNLDRFMEAYERNLRAAIAKDPKAYSYGVDQVPTVVGRMRAAVERGNYADSPMVTKTQKELGIGKSQKSLAAWLKRAPKPEVPVETKVLKVIPAQDGMEVHVARVTGGYSVSLKDADAGEMVGTSRIYPTEKQAMDAADVLAAGKPVGAKPGKTPKAEATPTEIEPVLAPAVDGPAIVSPTPVPIETLAAENPHTAGAVRLAEEILDRLRSTTTTFSIGDNVKFQAIADESFGGSRAQGTYELKDAYDALEAAINSYIADSIGPDMLTADPHYTLTALRAIMAGLPTQNVRSAEQESLQQFSTPPTLAFLVAKLAGVRQNDVVLEPSAGTGGLAAWARAAGAIVHTNEIDEYRRALLQWALRGDAPTNADAEFLHSILPADIKPTLVLMNPPFSATGGRVAKNSSEFGYRHVIEALKRLKPGGRLVAILGRGATLDAPTAQQFWQKVRDLGTVKINAGVSGREYAKYGTTFGNRVVVIDKIPSPEGVPQKPVTGDFETIEEAYDALKAAAERPSAVEGSSPGPVAGTLGPSRGTHGVRSPGVGSGVREPGASPAVQAPAPAPQVRPPSGSVAPTGQEPGPQAEPAIQPTGQTRGGPSGDSGGSAVTPARPEDRVALEHRKQEDLQARVEDDGAYVEYVPSIEGLAHPGRLVETKVMASVQPPPVTYRPNLPLGVIAKAPKPLSAAQMEAVARAGAMFNTFDESGHRLGILIGDGTGVGKGQELAAIVWERFRSGKRRALWVSASRALQNDAHRDFIGIGATEIADKLVSLNDYTASDDIELPEGVVFSTYSSLISKAQGDRGQTRLEQIEKWLGPEGVIIFDEGHRAKNAVSAGGRQAQPSKTGEAVLKIQEDLPKAYVVYSSATSATDVVNMGYMSRLGLWGKGTPFHEGFSHFMAEVGRGGVAAMELISRELKAMGRYLSRSISYKGVSFIELPHELTAEQIQTYDAAADAWQLVYQMATQQLKDNGATGHGSRAKGQFAQAYWGEQQRFYRKLLTAMKVPTLLDLVDKALADNKSVVISLIGTGQAQAEAALATGADEEDDLDFSPKDSLIRLIMANYPVTLYEEYTDDQGNVRSRPVKRDGKIQENREAVEKRDALVAKLNKELQLPDNPLDFIIRNYGRNAVAELTGRRKTVEKNKQGKWESVSRAPKGIPMDAINEYEMERFQSGKKRIAIISKAAGTGISLHADLTVKNQQPRYQIALELSWSADDQLQAFGRTHRTNQKQPPEYVILSTNAGGERRFSSTIARRLESLGALTKGQRDASGGASVLSKYNFETAQGEQAAKAFYDHLLQDEEIAEIGKTGHEVLKQMGLLKQQEDHDGNPVGQATVDRTDSTNVTRLLNRILNVRIGGQNHIYEYFTGVFDSVVQRAIEDGTLDTGVNLVRGDSILLAEAKPIATDPASGAATYHYNIDVERKNKPVPASVVEDYHRKGRGRMYKRREFKSGDVGSLIWAIPSGTPITNRSGKVEAAVNYFGPGHREGHEYQRFSKSELEQSWEPVEGEQAVEDIRSTSGSLRDAKVSLARAKEKKEDWEINYYTERIAKAEAKLKELHAQVNEAKKGQFNLWEQAHDAAPLARIEHIHMIGGSVMRIWSYLHVGRGRMDIRIAYPDSGGSITGIVMTEGNANQVERALTGVSVARTPSSVYEAALSGAERFNLTGGMRLTRHSLNREPVILVTVRDQNTMRFLDSIGVRRERINWDWRYYIPSNSQEGVPIVEKLLRQYPVVEEDVRPGQRGGAPLGPEAGVLVLPDITEQLRAIGRVMGVQQFVDQDLIPGLRNASTGTYQVIRWMVNAVSPTTGVDNKYIDELFKLKGDREKAQFILMCATEHMRQQLGEKADMGVVERVAAKRADLTARGLSPLRAFQVDFMDRIKTGQQQETQELRNIASFLRQADDALYKAITKYKDLTWLENHQRVLWKVIPGSPEARGFFGKSRRPLPGGMGYFRQHVFQNMSEGIALGGVPVTYNPVEMFTAHHEDVMKFLTAQKMWAQGKKMGALKFYKTGTRPDDTDAWVQINDRMAQAYYRREGVLTKAGEWWAERGFGRMLNNYLSPDRLRQRGTALGFIGRSLISAKNFYTAVELTASAFHASFISLEAGTSSMALGMSKIINRALAKKEYGVAGEAFMDFLRGTLFPWAATTYFQTGKAGISLVKNPEEFAKTPEGQALLKMIPNAREIMDDIFAGGAKLDVHHEYIRNAVSNFKTAWADGNKPGALLFRSLPASMELMMKPLFEWYIPRVKVAAFLKEFSNELIVREGQLAKGQVTRAQLARERWKFIEDRFGEMNFDNLWWDRTMKTAAQIAWRSVTWWLGSVRAGGRAPFGQGKELWDAMRQHRTPILTLEFSWLFCVAILSTVLSTIAMGIYGTGRPKTIKDTTYPQTDPTDDRVRISLPTYQKVYYGILHDPKAALMSGMSGLLGRSINALRNRNFYNQRLWNTDDEWPTKAKAFLKELLVPVPISIQSEQSKHPERGIIETVARLPISASFWGMPKAPRWVSETPLEAKMSEYKQENRAGKKATERVTMIGKISAAVRANNMDAARKLADEGIAKGILRESPDPHHDDVNLAIERAGKPYLEGTFKSLPAEVALDVFALGNKDERDRLVQILDEKVTKRAAQNLSVLEVQVLQQKLQKLEKMGFIPPQ